MLPREGQLYGEWHQAIGFNHPREHAGHILGAHVSMNASGQPAAVEIQWKAAQTGKVHEMQMDWLNAMALLSFLKSMQLDSGHPFPNDPRNPNWRAGDGKP